LKVAKYTIREANDSDLPGIVRLRHGIKEFRALNTDEYESFWNSLIRVNPCLIRKVLVAVNVQNEIVAHYAMVPFKFFKEGEQLIGSFLCQLMVREDFRNELVFPRMELKFIKEYTDAGIDFAYSLGSREHVVKAHLSFGFCKIGDLPVYALPINVSSLARKIINNSAIHFILRPFYFVAEKYFRIMKHVNMGAIVVDNVSKFESTLDTFIAGLKSYFPYSALRNAEVLNWRFGSGVSSDYHLFIARDHDHTAGYMVLRRMQMKQFDVLAVIDIMFSPDRNDVGIALLSTAHKTAIDMNVDMSACLLNSYDPLCPTLKRCGYFKTPEVFSLFVHEPKGASPHFETDSLDQWHITWFDNDAV
jgi:hypothetical protein